MSETKGLLIFPIIKDLNKPDGILLKNEGIRKAFLENSVQVDVLEFTSKGIFNQDEQLFSFRKGKYGRMYQYYITAWKEIADYIAGKNYDFIWFRMPLVTYFIARFIKSIKEKRPHCKIILEYGAYPFADELTGLKKRFYLLNRNNEIKAHQYADFVITYSGQEKVDNLVNIPINNGIDLSGIPVNPEASIDKGINFISVSSLKKWHAYERFIEGMASYIREPGTTPIHFNIVGNGPDYGKLSSLANELKLNDYISFHDFKTGKELDRIYEQNHVAIGTLGFHRIGITNSSSLKNREYFARGLPIVLSTPDLDMPNDLSFVKYVPEGEDPINIKSVVAFAKEVYASAGLHKMIRAYADENVSWNSKIKTILDYLNGVHIVETDVPKNKIYS